MPRILALTIRPIAGPDTRYRIAQYSEPFRQAGLEIVCQPLFSPRYYQLLGHSGHVLSKAMGLGAAFVRRLVQIVRQASQFDAIWIGRELFPLGPPVLETLLFQKNCPVILDIDDAIFLPDDTNKGFIHRKLRDFDKLGRIAHKFQAIVCGNAFLANYFRGKNTNVHIIPTVVPMATYGHIARTASSRPRIGWIGTPHSARHLDIVRQPLQRLAQHHDFSFQVVGLSQPLNWELPHLAHIPWNLDQEAHYFSKFDIGIMPLYDFPFSRGKCAFKIIQYMAAGIPVVASPVGSNLDVVQDGKNGFLADSAQDWEHALTRLIEDSQLAHSMGLAGRHTVQKQFSLEEHWKHYADIIKSCL
ncbi:glycosyltransferase family 4 protein [Desulfovibrionales bacterium]